MSQITDDKKLEHLKEIARNYGIKGNINRMSESTLRKKIRIAQVNPLLSDQDYADFAKLSYAIMHHHVKSFTEDISEDIILHCNNELVKEVENTIANFIKDFGTDIIRTKYVIQKIEQMLPKAKEESNT